jgi:AraC family transcriptional regulator
MHMNSATMATSLVPAQWLHLMPSPPTLSSEGLGWRRLCAYRVKYPAQFSIQLPAAGGHLLSAHLRNPCQLTTRWNGTERRRQSLPGESIIMCANQENSWIGTGEIDELQIFLDPALLREAAAEISDKTVGLVEGIGIRDPLLSVVAARLVDELSNPGSTCRLVGDAMAHALTAQLLSRHSNFCGATSLERIDMPAHKVRMAIDYIESRLSEDVSIDSIATAIKMSAFRFARGFKKATGTSPHQFLLDRRIEHAKDLLRSTGYKLADIAQCVGFANQSHFTSVFRRKCQMTPKSYRRLTRSSS